MKRGSWKVTVFDCTQETTINNSDKESKMIAKIFIFFFIAVQVNNPPLGI